MRFVLALVAITALAAALAAFAPATLLDGRLAAATEGRLRLADPTGTLWNGRGLLTSAEQRWSLPVGWTVDPRAALHGGARVTLVPANEAETPRGSVAWRDGTLDLDGLSASLPAAALDDLATTGNVLALGGRIGIDATHFRWNGTSGEGALTVQWSGARVAGSDGAIALGTVSATITPQGDKLAGRLANRGADVRIDGEVTLDGAAANLDATLRPSPSAPPEVARALGGLGTPDGAGAVRLQWRVALR